MKITQIKLTVLVLLLTFSSVYTYGQEAKKTKADITIDTLAYEMQNGDVRFELTFLKGESFNHPTFAIWVEDPNGNYVETIFVTQYFASGTFGNADAGDGTWKADKGESIRPAALPYWAHKRNVISRDSLYVPTPENPVTDAITGATPTNSFVLQTNMDTHAKDKVIVLFEINQSWDWNDYWTNDKYPEDKDYLASSQPSVVYAAEIDLKQKDFKTELKPIGHGHYSGKDGSLTKDLSTLSTALEISNQINVSITQK